VFDGPKRWAGAQIWRASGRAARNRATLYGGAGGLRVLTFHHTGPRELAGLARIVDWCRGRLPLASPTDADALFSGRWPHGTGDRLLLTFDDGLASNHQAACWLAARGIHGVFFVVPSLVGRSLEEYLAYHQGHGVRAHRPLAPRGARGLSAAQVREMRAMGHRIGSHNFAHRDLGGLTAPDDLRYEIDRALGGVAALTGEPCGDFAIAFGQPENVSPEAAEYLLARGPRVYACHRGLNVPGVTPAFLLRQEWRAGYPFAFTQACLDGSADHHLASRAARMVRRVGTLPSAGGEPVVAAWARGGVR
jgi:peptidoglycan/xylan/chitin deacetylase (PgdA/CDA1 family)